MYHFELNTPTEEAKYRAAYFRLTGAVTEALGLYRCVLTEVEKAMGATGKDTYIAPLLLMYEFAEVVDGVRLLVEQGSARNCEVLMRVALEVHIGLRYMVNVDDPDEFTRRSLAYEYFHLWENLKGAERLNPKSKTGQQVRAEMKNQLGEQAFDETAARIDLAGEMEKYRRKMDSDRFAEVRAEVERMTALGQKVKDWYVLWGGPGDVRQMARKVELGTLYESLYRHWSKTVHGAGAIKRLDKKSTPDSPLLVGRHYSIAG